MGQYRTVSGDTWDLIAYKVYPKHGRERLMSALIGANPQHINTVIFPAGITLSIPEPDIPTPRTLPPWIGE
ncbi:MAG: tail protein X [Synergistaceae bacterium]|nr:tail protein X [Synergistaceae bacterium]MBQ3653608.1 tail protein X [Synergistaceae bacterium]